MKLFWTEEGWEDYLYWQQADPVLLRKINDLLRDAMRQPFRGLGKPEPLKGNLSGWWSRRITGDHRLVYRVAGSGPDQRLEIIQCQYHY